MYQGEIGYCRGCGWYCIAVDVVVGADVGAGVGRVRFTLIVTLILMQVGDIGMVVHRAVSLICYVVDI